MRTILRNKRIGIAIVAVAILSMLYLLFIYKTPEQLASEIRLCELHPNVRREIEEKGGVNTDSTWVLTRERGNIRGELVVRHNSSKAYAHYYQIYDE